MPETVRSAKANSFNPFNRRLWGNFSPPCRLLVQGILVIALQCAEKSKDRGLLRGGAVLPQGEGL